MKNEDSGITQPPMSPDETIKEATSTMASNLSSSIGPTSGVTVTLTSEGETPSTDKDDVLNNGTEEVTTRPLPSASVSVSGSGKAGGDGHVTTVSKTTVSMTTTVSSTKAAVGDKDHSSWGYVILVLIILVIIVLCVILYFLRRVSRTYSFDLQRPSPVSHLNQPTGTFEPVYLDDLERPDLKDRVTTDDLSPSPVANGTSLPSEEKGSVGENAPQEQPDSNGVEMSPTSNTSSSPADNQEDKMLDPLSSADLFFDTIGEQQNENNNNPSVCSSDPFVEINLDGPAWCDQLLTSPENPSSSSVLPFTPFSFSTSSS